MSAVSSRSVHPQTLYTYPENFRAFKVLIAAHYSGAQVRVADSFQLGKTNAEPSFLEKFPLGKVSGCSVRLQIGS